MRPRSRQGSLCRAWIYFDLVKDGHPIHLQVFANVERGKISSASAGLLDLDASHKTPMPVGETGSVAIEGDVVTYTITPDALQLVNKSDDEVHAVGEGVPVKWIEASTYVSHDLSRLSLRIGRDGRYHEYARPESQHGLSQVRTTRHGVSGATSRFVGATTLSASIADSRRLLPSARRRRVGVLGARGAEPARFVGALVSPLTEQMAPSTAVDCPARARALLSSRQTVSRSRTASLVKRSVAPIRSVR